MATLKKQFGRLVAAHRRRREWTQAELAEHSRLSMDMIAKIETGATGVSFAALEKLASSLQVHPAELFSTEVPSGAIRRPAWVQLTSILAGLSEDELRWLQPIIEAILRRRP